MSELNCKANGISEIRSQTLPYQLHRLKKFQNQDRKCDRTSAGGWSTCKISAQHRGKEIQSAPTTRPPCFQENNCRMNYHLDKLHNKYRQHSHLESHQHRGCLKQVSTHVNRSCDLRLNLRSSGKVSISRTCWYDAYFTTSQRCRTRWIKMTHGDDKLRIIRFRRCQINF